MAEKMPHEQGAKTQQKFRNRSFISVRFAVLTAANMKIALFWVAALCILTRHDDGGSKHLRNICELLPEHTMQQLKTQPFFITMFTSAHQWYIQTVSTFLHLIFFITVIRFDIIVSFFILLSHCFSFDFSSCYSYFLYQSGLISSESFHIFVSILFNEE
jgi:hypothetical protein